MKNDPQAWLKLIRTVRFGDTDAAGVLHFHQLLRWCHEAWEESLETYGLPSDKVFPSCKTDECLLKTGLPVIHCQANFRHPIHAGDKLIVIINPIKLNSSSFEIKTTFYLGTKALAIGLMRHLAINKESRNRVPIPDEIERWLEASSINQGPTPI